MWSLSPDKVTFFDWCSPPETSCKYSATADLAITSNLRAPSSHTQQWTPLRPENTHSKCWYPKSSEEQMLVHNNRTKYYWDTCVLTLQMVHNNKRSTITVETLWFSQQLILQTQSFRMWQHLVWLIGTDILDQPAASNFRVEKFESKWQQVSLKHLCLCTRLYGVTLQKTVTLYLPLYCRFLNYSMTKNLNQTQPSYV